MKLIYGFINQIQHCMSFPVAQSQNKSLANFVLILTLPVIMNVG